VWQVGLRVDRLPSKNKDSLGRARDTKVLGLVSMVCSSCAGILCDSTVANCNAVDKTAVSEEAWACLDEVTQEIEQRLAADVIWFWGLHEAELVGSEGEKPPLVDAVNSSPEEVLAAFGSEMVGVRKTFLWEHYAAFTGTDFLSWMASRTVTNDKCTVGLCETFLANKWIASVSGATALEDNFEMWTLTKAGIAVWDCNYRVYEANVGSKQLMTEDQFIAQCDASDLELLEECVKSLGGGYSQEVLKNMTGTQLCLMVLKRAEIPHDIAFNVAGQLVACGYMQCLDSTSGDFTYRGCYGLAELLSTHRLNGRRRWVGSIEGRNAMEVSVVCYTQIRDSWNMLRQSSLQMAVTSLPPWKRFCDMVIELQRVNLDALADESARLVFWINVHNTLFLHAWIVHRDVFVPPESAPERACYLVNGREMTLAGIKAIVSGDVAASDPSSKWNVGLSGQKLLANLLFSNNYRACLTVIRSGKALDEDIARQAADDLANVILEDNSVLRVPHVMARVVERASDAEEVTRLVLPYLAPTWQGIVQKVLDNKMPLRVEFVAAEPEALVWGAASDDSAVGGGMSKDLWAEGVLKKHNEARAAAAAIRAESQLLQLEFDRAQEQQQQHKAQNEVQEEQSRGLEQELKRTKLDFESLQREAAEKRALVAEAKARALRVVAAARDTHTNFVAVLQSELGISHPTLDALFERAVNAPLVVASTSGSGSGAAAGGGGGGQAEDREFLKTRDPLVVAPSGGDAGPFKWAEQQHLKWLKEKCRQFVPSLPGDDAFLSAITRVHTELLEDPTQLDRFAEKGLVESYARFFSTWKDRVEALLSRVLVSGSDTPAIVAASGWFNAENILVGVLRYRKQYAVLQDKIDRLYESIGIDAGTLELAAELPELVGLASKPGRFLLMRGRVPCRRGADATERELDFIVLSDILVVGGDEKGVRVHKLEQCVALEAQDATQLEVFDSGAGSRFILHLGTPETRDLWLRKLSFACTLTKLKLRKTKGETPQRKQPGAEDSFDTESIKAEIERKRASVRSPLSASQIAAAGAEDTGAALASSSEQPSVGSPVPGRDRRRLMHNKGSLSMDSHDFKAEMRGGK
jgi:hypothetical protein